MQEIWEKAALLLKEYLEPDRYQRWLSNIVSVTRQNNFVLIAVTDELSREWMESNLASIFDTVLEEVSGEQLKTLFITLEEDDPSATLSSPQISLPAREPRYKQNQNQNASVFNARYTFDTFVVGNSNRFAHAAAWAAAERPARAYNPLFIYGGSGLGKTHLMHAIGHYVLEKNPGMNVVYVSSEMFTNQFISNVRTGDAFRFRDHYRNADIFLIDDIQFIAEKERTQEEFFHTFNTLYQANKQIVISSDRPPKEIPTLEERLRSRFEMGLIVDIQPPDLETRIAILQNKAKRENMMVSNEVLSFIAERARSNIRELEGALNSIFYYASLNGFTSISLEAAEEALKGILPEKSKKPIDAQRIMQCVADYYNIKIDDLQSKKRDRNLAFPRQIAMYLCRELTGDSLPKIAKDFGRDHSTVIHARDKIEKEKKNDISLENNINEIIAIIKEN